MMEWIARLLSALFGSWLSERHKVQEAETVGSQKVIIASQEKDIAEIAEADAARDAVARAVADHPDKLRDATDPDCQDCSAG